MVSQTVHSDGRNQIMLIFYTDQPIPLRFLLVPDRSVRLAKPKTNSRLMKGRKKTRPERLLGPVNKQANDEFCFPCLCVNVRLNGAISCQLVMEA